MRRRSLGVTAALAVVTVVPLAWLAPTAAAKSVAGPNDRTGPAGPFGFTTKGLGATSNYGEPSLAIAPDGHHVVASTPGFTSQGPPVLGSGGVQYWYSSDTGKTWKTSFTTATTSQSGGGDSELDFLPDGSLLSADLEITDSYVHRSTDFGKTWTAIGPVGIEQDRQWFAHSPDGKKAYLVYHDFVAEGEFFAQSSDGGKTWPAADKARPVTSADQITLPGAATTPAKGGAPASLLDQGINTFSGPMLVDNNGKDMYVVYSISNLESNLDPTIGIPPFGPVRGLVVAHSGDAGSTWTNRYAVVAQPDPTQPAEETTENSLFPWGTIDAGGNVYIVFNSTRGTDGTRFHQYYTYSSNKGKSWSKPVRLDALGLNKGSAIYSNAAGGAAGVLDVAWYQTDNGKPTDDASIWQVHFAQVVGANTRHPKVTEQKVTTVPNHTGGICLQGTLCVSPTAPGSHDRSLLDFFEVAINPKTGFAGIAYADNHRLGLDDSGDKIGEVVYAAQTRGRSALAPVRSGSGAGAPNRQTEDRATLATTGMRPLVAVGALLLVGAAVLVRRRLVRLA